MALLPSPADLLRRTLVGEVRALFNDQARQQRPIERSAAALCAPDSVAWRVHGDITTMMVGGVSALLLQMLHPGALAGVWDHSNFKADMLGRLRNTARFIAVTTYGERDAALAAIARVRAIHDHVHGTLPDGTPYSANDPHLLSWIHVAGSAMFLAAWRRFGEPAMSVADQDRYWADVAEPALLLGADRIPRTHAEAFRLLDSYRAELSNGPRSRDIATAILTAPPPSPAAAPLQSLVMQAGVDLLPDWARQLHGLQPSTVSRPLVLGATTLLTRTMQWAFAPYASAPRPQPLQT